MKTTVYADVLLVRCSLMVFAAYSAVALVWGEKYRLHRLAFGSFAVSLISTAAVLFARRFINFPCVLCLIMLGTYFCFGSLGFKRNIYISFTALAGAFAVGGARTALENTGIKAGLFVTAALLFACLGVFLKKIRSAVVKKQQLCRLTVCRGEKSAELCALVDSGNELRGAHSESVIVAERQAVSCLFEGAETEIRLLPCKSAGGEGALIGVLCDYALVNGKKCEGVIVAAVDMRLGGAYNALIGTELSKTGDGSLSCVGGSVTRKQSHTSKKQDGEPSPVLGGR